ncbi:hypothetical protein NPX13_g607 [Xylaria arbuscula]|uniref:CENP-V/GFA domain-containing protein n=1 Tax=Xylaria arbuscula TaxID=114810 RepID=A0A9W8NN69_9PEZI|nr:hypothetical protein NPX13_g607 [Xylaria arbuscula]
MLSISCHCGSAKQTVRLCEQPSNAPQEISLCHCSACRHSTGSLCVSYVNIDRPSSVEGLVEYRSNSGTITRFFCATCGCHVFRRLESAPAIDSIPSTKLTTPGGYKPWAVATGVIIGLDAGNESSYQSNRARLMRYAKHINTASTKDGGLSSFMRHVENSGELEAVEDMTSPTGHTLTLEQDRPEEADRIKEREEVLNASCHCKAVQFHITRPNATSQLPRSNFPDLMIPYHTGSPLVKNPEDMKWWLRPGLRLDSDEHEAQSSQKGELRRYLAGTCACRSCRLTLGFEIQSWAFIPRANIFFHIRHVSSSEAGAGKDTHEVVPLDFETLPVDILMSYESSPGVRREFCRSCGATVFWRDRWRPELMDVSIGLLDADEGSRAETWLDWWTARVSFSEDAGNGRAGEVANNARCLIDGLETGLRVQGKWKARDKTQTF